MMWNDDRWSTKTSYSETFAYNSECLMLNNVESGFRIHIYKNKLVVVMFIYEVMSELNKRIQNLLTAIEKFNAYGLENNWDTKCF